MQDIPQLLDLLTWTLPPVIGALIGYITNDIAIKMLFRPLRARYIGTWRLPFTPGIIPRQREKLAESIGVMVSRELITEDALRRQISSEAFQKSLSMRISELSGLVLSTPVNELSASLKGGKSRQISREGDVPADTLLVQDILSSFFQSGAFFNGLQSSLSLALDSFFLLKVKNIAGKDGSRLFAFLKFNVNLGGLRDPLRKLAMDLVEEGIRKNIPLDRLLSPPAIEGIIRGIDRLYPALARELLGFLRTPHIHTTLEQKGRTVLRRLISRMSSLQRIFLMAGQYNRNIEEQMDEIVDDALEQLEAAVADEVTRRKVLDTIKSWLQRMSSHTLSDIAGVWGETLPADAGKGVDALFDLLQSPQVSEWGKALIARVLREYGDTGIGELLSSLTGMERRELSEVLADWVGSLIRSAETESNTTFRFFRQLISALSDDGRRSISTIIRLEEDHKARLNILLEKFVLDLIDTQVPNILESVDVNSLVVEKINSLDIEKVEELILIVIRTHLRYIIFFGAVLGFFIGSLQVVLTKLI